MTIDAFEGGLLTLKRKDNMAKGKAIYIDADEREQIVFQRSYDPKHYEYGGTCRFSNLPLEKIEALIEKGFLSPRDCQNSSPTAEEFIVFAKRHNPSNWSFHGYVVSPERSDCRVTIEGIESNGPLTKDDLIDFLLLVSSADDLVADRDKPVYCWYD